MQFRLIQYQSWFRGAYRRDIAFPISRWPVSFRSAICQAIETLDFIFWRCIQSQSWKFSHQGRTYGSSTQWYWYRCGLRGSEYGHLFLSLDRQILESPSGQVTQWPGNQVVNPILLVDVNPCNFSYWLGRKVVANDYTDNDGDRIMTLILESPNFDIYKTNAIFLGYLRTCWTLH